MLQCETCENNIESGSVSTSIGALQECVCGNMKRSTLESSEVAHFFHDVHCITDLAQKACTSQLRWHSHAMEMPNAAIALGETVWQTVLLDGFELPTSKIVK